MLKRLYLLSMPLLCSLQTAASVNPLGQEITITSILKTQERILGQVNLTIGASGELSIPTEDIYFTLEKILPEEVLQKLETQAKDNKITDSIFKELGFPLSLDPQTYELLINIPIDANRVNSISIGNEKSKTTVSKPSTFSGYLNTFFGVSHEKSAGEDSFSQNHRFNAGLNYRAANLTYEAEFLDSSADDSQFNRTFTQFSYDLPNEGTRFVLGDIITPRTTFQSGADIAGIGIIRNFSNIPTRNLRSTGSQQFTLRRTSNIDVMVDGIIMQRLKLPAGRYDINDIPLARGNNNVKLLIQDEAGNEETISFAIAIDNNLIKQGEFEYALTAGVTSSIENNELTYDSSDILTTGFLEYGLLPSWTIGFNGQNYDKNFQFGFTSLNAWRFGTTELLYSHSINELNGEGHAYRLSYVTPQEFQDQHNLQFQAQYEYFSPSFSSVESEIYEDVRSVVQHNLKMSVSTNFNESYHAALNANVQKGYFSKENSWSLGTTLSGPIFDTDATFGLSLRYLTDFQQEKEFDVTATVTYPFKNKHKFISQYRNNAHEYQLDYSYLDDTDVVGGKSVNLNMLTNDKDGFVVNGDLDYVANRFNVGFSHDTRAQSLAGDNAITSTKVSFDTAIAFSGKEVAIGRPVDPNFAVISPNKNLKNTPIHILPKDNDKAHVISRNSRNVLISNLSPYSEQTIDFEIKDLPAGYDLGAGIFAVNPMYGQAYQFKIGADAAHTLMGYLIDKETDKPISLTAGKAYQASAPEHKLDFFSTKGGRVAITGMSSGDWILELNTNPIRTVEVTLIENANMLDQKGKIYVN